MLLHRLQKVNISSDESSNEFWCVREICKETADDRDDAAAGSTATNAADAKLSIDFIANAEHELYVMGSTAVWTKGICDEQQQSLPSMCFTCETPIRYALFCSANFFKCPNPDKRAPMDKKRTCDVRNASDVDDISICLIDATTLRVYSSGGDDYRTSLEFPISKVWQSRTALLFERSASSSTVGQESIPMPTLFSVTHPLNEVCPVLFKSANGTVNLLTEPDYRIVFSNPENDLVMLFDYRNGKHFLAKLREATADEKQVITGRDGDGE